MQTDSPVRQVKKDYFTERFGRFLPVETGLIEPPCPWFEDCGGCLLQRVPYDVQLDLKRALLLKELEDNGLAGMEGVVERTIGDPESSLGYRNKADFSARTWDGCLHIGFRPFGGKGNLIEMEYCPIALPCINETLSAVRKALESENTLARKLVSVVIRASKRLGRTTLLFHSKLKDVEVYHRLVEKAMEHCSSLAGGMFVERKREHRWGETEITETVGPFEFRYSVRSFFQGNPALLPRLCATVEELSSERRGNSVFLDVYSGVGLFTIYLASGFEQAFGIENSPSSHAAARLNAASNRVDNITFLRDMAEERLLQFQKTGIHPDLVVLDPPRSGLKPAVVDCLVSMFPSPVVVLVSCNPSTFARDAALLVKGGYTLERVVPIDMFPQTEHLEVVARLARE